MKVIDRTRLLGILLFLGVLAPASERAGANGTTAEVVVTWNRILQESFPTQGVGTLRPFSMTHIAMFDAINAIERDYEPYLVKRRSGDGGSPEAAAAQAAHDVLVALNSAATATYDAALAEQLGQKPSGFVRRGAAVGARVAQEVLAWRQNDGWIVNPIPAYVEYALPGRYQRTQPNNPTPTFTHLQHAAPMALVSSTQFLPPPPPALTSERYATDVNEVKSLGKDTSMARSGEQTLIARLWAGVGAAGTPGTTSTNFLSVLNNVARDAAAQRGLSLVETARLFVLVNVSIHDALQTTQTSKYIFNLWRPVTAIRQADTDLNPATDPDAAWLPLITTPPYPSYAGNISTIGNSAARALQLALGTNDMPLTLTWKQSSGQPDVVRQFNSFGEIADEMFMARIWSGIHYRFDQEAGQQVGRSVAEYVHANVMHPRGKWNNGD